VGGDSKDRAVAAAAKTTERISNSTSPSLEQLQKNLQQAAVRANFVHAGQYFKVTQAPAAAELTSRLAEPHPAGGSSKQYATAVAKAAAAATTSVS